MSDPAKEIEQAAEAIMKAAGTSMRHYIPSTRAAIISAVTQVYTSAWCKGGDSALRIARQAGMFRESGE